MKSILNILKVLIIMFWVGLMLGFGGFVFFGDEIKEFLYSIFPSLDAFIEYMGFTQDTLESFMVFSAIIMIPVTILVFKVSARYSKTKVAPKRVPNTVARPTKAIAPKKAKVAKVPKAKIIKPKAVKKVKEPKVKVVSRKISTEGIGLTGLIINK